MRRLINYDGFIFTAYSYRVSYKDRVSLESVGLFLKNLLSFVKRFVKVRAFEARFEMAGQSILHLTSTVR